MAPKAGLYGTQYQYQYSQIFSDFFCSQNRCIDRIFVKLESSKSKFSFVGKKYTSRRAEIG